MTDMSRTQDEGHLLLSADRNYFASVSTTAGTVLDGLEFKTDVKI